MFQCVKHLQMLEEERQILLELNLLMLVGPSHLDSLISQFAPVGVFHHFLEQEGEEDLTKVFAGIQSYFPLKI